MKTLFTLLFISICLYNTNAQTITWSGAVDNNFSTPGNWVGGVAPTATDNVLFDGTAPVDCNLDIDIVVNSFSITSGYGGIINCTGFILEIDGNFYQEDGIFIASDVSMDIVNYTPLSVTSVIVTSGGTFDNNSGSVNLFFENGSTFNVSGFNGGNMLNNLTLRLTSIVGTTQRNVNFSSVDVNTLSVFGNKVFGYQGTLNIKQSLTTTNTGSGIPTSNTGTFIFNGSAITITGGSANRSIFPNITINASGVTPTMTGNINLSGTWLHTLSSASAAVGTSTVNFHGPSAGITTNISAASNAIRRAKFNNVVIQTGATCTLANRAMALISGNFTNNGTFNANVTSILGFSGSGTQNLTGTAAKTTLGSLYNVGSHTLVLGHNVDVLDSVKCETETAVINTNSKILTLKSTNALKGRIAQINGTGAAAIIGNITVETFAKGGSTGWTNLGVSGINGATVASWDGQFPMTCVGCINDEMSAGGRFVSIQGYNEAGSGGAEYVELTGSSALPVGKGTWTYLGTGLSTTSDITYAVTGTAAQSTVNIPLTFTGGGAQPGYNLIANPYPSPISWSKTRAIGTNATLVQNAIYIYNPDLGVTGSFVGGVSTGGVTNTIPMGQGFYVEATGAGNIQFTEFAKSNQNKSTNQLLKTASTNSMSIDPVTGDTIVTYETEVSVPIGTIFRLGITGTSSDYDETVLRLEPSATPSFDRELDAHKIFQSPGYLGYPGPYTHYTTISTKSGTEDYSINSLSAPITGSLTIPVVARVMATGPYVISPIEIGNLSAFGCVTLHDKLTGTYHNLRTGSYSCNINDTTTAARFELIVCAGSVATSINNLVIDNSVIISQDGTSAFVKTAFEANETSVISAYNIMGQKIIDDITIEGKSNLTRLNFNNIHNQIVIIKVTTNKTQTTKKVFVN